MQQMTCTAKLGSLFDGIAGFPASAEKHGIKPVWASEIEAFPISVSKKHFPNMSHLGDIAKINGAEIEPVDVISFGSPCQDLSVAGKQKGFGKCVRYKPANIAWLVPSRVKKQGLKLRRYSQPTRSGLFKQAIRIIREMRGATNGEYPRFAIWENVPGAFTSNKRQDFRAVLEEIMEAEIPMPKSGKWANAGMVRGNGRSLAWRVLDAQYWGVPQRRRRISLVADFRGQCAGQILFEPQGLLGDTEESGKAREEVAAASGTGPEGTSSIAVRMREGCAGGGARGR